VQPLDGRSLKPLFTAEIGPREKAIPFRYGQKAALVDNGFKLLTNDLAKGPFELYDLEADPKETQDLSASQPKRFEKMKAELLAWSASVDASFAGQDYPERRVSPADPEPIAWYESALYLPYLAEWKSYWAYDSYMNRPAKGVKKGKKK
jgi:arylsulfatase A-like enzyme